MKVPILLSTNLGDKTNLQFKNVLIYKHFLQPSFLLHKYTCLNSVTWESNAN